jgi:hypothetical protein
LLCKILFSKLRFVRFGKTNQDVVLRGHCESLSFQNLRGEMLSNCDLGCM